jgi:protein-S-isoprenylcysteine O-methyltransferase Ste14
MTTTFLVLAGLCLAGVSIRTVYEVLKRSGRVTPGSRLVFGVVLAAMCALLATWPFLGSSDPWRLDLPDAVGWIGLAMSAVALAVAVGGLVQLRGVEDIDHLVTSGLYSRLRHPMYYAFILWIAGWVVQSGALASLGVGMVCTAAILYWRHLEEIALESRYGEVYQAYRSRSW